MLVGAGAARELPGTRTRSPRPPCAVLLLPGSKHGDETLRSTRHGNETLLGSRPQCERYSERGNEFGVNVELGIGNREAFRAGKEVKTEGDWMCGYESGGPWWASTFLRRRHIEEAASN